MNIEELKVGNRVRINFQRGQYGDYVIEQLDKVNHRAELKEFGKESSPFVITHQDQWNMLEGIPFEKKHLDEYDFLEDSSYRVYGLPDTGAFVKFVSMKTNNYPYIMVDILVRQERGNWVLVLKDDRAKFGCRFLPIPYLHIFQNCLANWYGL